LQENGISLVGTADKSIKYLITTREKMASVLGVSLAASKTHVLIKLSAGRNVHPSCKPISLMSYLITLTTKPREIVLDPFMGSGTTAIAAHMMNRQFIGYEKEPDYHKIATERIAHYLKQCKLSMVDDKN
jgi:DNA modification methylase